MDYELNKRYFKKVDETIHAQVNFKSAIIWIVIGVIVFFCFIRLAAIIGIIGLCFIGIGIAMIVSQKNKVASEESRVASEKASIPSDSQYDAEVRKKLNGLKEQALQALGIDEDEVREIDPISFDGYSFKGVDNIKMGKDNLWRTNKYEYTILFFSEHEVHCYTYSFDTTFENSHHTTDLYFYKDIVSATTDHESVKVQNQNVDYDFFKLTTAGGTALSVSLRDVSNAQRSINAMRTLLKAKKQQG